jgi:PleD family two-component response regulator
MALTTLRATSPAALPAVLRVLVVDRSTLTARTVRRALEAEPGIRVHVARGPGSAVRVIEKEPFDAVLIDQQIWNDGPPGLGAKLRQESDLAVVLITDEETPEAGLGAHDCIARSSLDRNRLLERLGSAIAETRGARRRETMVRWLERDARTDRASGLFNRASFNERLREACRQSTISGTPVTVLSIALLSESPEQESGAPEERLMRRAAAGITRAIRSEDFASRAGEFSLAVVLPGADLTLGRRIARRIAQEVERLNSEAWPEESPVSLLFGVASGTACEPDELYAAAEANVARPASGASRALRRGSREERDGPSVA